MTVDDKVCDQVSMTMLSDVYPREVIKRCVQHSEQWCSKVRQVRLSTALTLVLFVIAMALWSRRNQCQVWHSLVGKLSDLHPAQSKSTMSYSGLTEMLSLALTMESEEAMVRLLPRLQHKMARHVLPPRRLRVNRREIKQIYHKYKPKKRQVPPPDPFNPGDQFLDFVEVLDPLAPALPVGGP
jgi:hypothetical protein